MISNYFEQFNPTDIKGFSLEKSKTISHNLHFFNDILPKNGLIDIAIIGITSEINLVREQLYRLQFPFRNILIGDLGNIKKADPIYLNPVIAHLLEANIVPIILSSSIDLLKPVSLAFEQQKTLFNITCLNRSIPFSLSGNKKSILNTILEREKSHLDSIDFIGYQEHFADTSYEIQDQEKFVNFVSFGQASENIEEVEPYIRNSNLFSLDMNVIKWSDAPGQNNPSPSGFLSTEVCQLTRYAGINSKMKCIFIHGFNFKKDIAHITAKSIAEIIWYFLDGFNVRNLTRDTDSSHCTEFMVDSKYLDTPIVFVRNNQTDKWWFHFEYEKPLSEINKLLACSYEDYLGACNEELSERMIRAIKRNITF